MREIKFRIWSKYSEKMVDEGFYISQNSDLFQNDSLDYKNKDSFEIMQYTGLKDKNGNGKEIYEDDVCKRKIFAFGEIRTFIGKVKMFEGRWWLDSGTAAVPLWNEMHELEVIGNIYENPELLER